MQYEITAPKSLNMTVKLPASKSISNRALIINALADNDSLPENLSDCDDTEVIVQALKEAPYEINIKAAGTAMRFMTAYLSTRLNEEHVLTGTERMKHRPIHILVDALRLLGADIEYMGEEGFPPLLIKGRKLAGGRLEVPGNVSSQFISALLLIGPCLSNGLSLRLTGDIISRPYIDLTLWMMREFGANADWSAFDTITVAGTPYRQRSYYIENDWSAASYWYEMMALTRQEDAEIRLEGLMDGSKQGDSSVRYLFSLLGVKTVFASKTPGVPTRVTLRKGAGRVRRLEYDFVNAPDLAQTLVCTCCALGVPFHFTGLQTLKIKETDRIEALKAELGKLGFEIKDINSRELTWDGKTMPPAAAASSTGEHSINTYDDHRMALAFAPMALRIPISIEHPEVVTKSYPRYWDDLRQAGFIIE